MSSRSLHPGSGHLLVGLFFAITLASTHCMPALAQEPGWVVRRSYAAELWFHGLAVTRFTGFGDFPLYAPGYADSVARARPISASASRLDARAEGFREAFLSDSAFEVLHFVPLYSPNSEPLALLAALRGAALEPRNTRIGPRERFGVAATLAALPTPAERRTLAEFAEALEDEWRRSFARATATRAVDSVRLREFEAGWRPLERAIAPYLRAHRLSGGLLLLVPSLGPDGRLFEGDPKAGDDNVIAVGLPASPSDAVFLVVRELCYPAVRRALATGRFSTADRVSLERLSGTAAVRCGALALARYAPESVAAYEAAWLRATKRSAPFGNAFPLPEHLLLALEAVLKGR